MRFLGEGGRGWQVVSSGLNWIGLLGKGHGSMGIELFWVGKA